MQTKNKDLKKRILDISFKLKLSHISSCLEAVDIIDYIYKTKKADEPFILSQGHAGLALYTVLEKYEGKNAEELFEKHGVHPNRDLVDGIYCSTGSLGQGLPIAVGMALADRTKNVYCLISDGECAEGSIWEALMIAHKFELDNLKIYINFNGYSGYGETSQMILKLLKEFNYTISITPEVSNVDYIPFLAGLQGHYKVMNDEEYQLALRSLNEQS